MTRPAVFLLAFIASATLRAEVTPGEILIAEMNCAACHDAGEHTARLASRQSPRLGADGVRATAHWLREFLADPQKARPGTLMPDSLHALPPEQKAEAADALTHFLISLQPPVESQRRGASEATIAEGDRLYHSTGCVMCHAPFRLPAGKENDPAAQQELAALRQSSVPMGEGIAKKYSLPELTRFLFDPLKARPAGRMPAMNLSETEAEAIAMFLLREQKAEIPAQAFAHGTRPMRPVGDAPFSVDAAKAARGRQLFADMNCAACHRLDAPGKMAKPLARLAARQPRGCLSSRPAPNVPKFEITDRQRQVILALLQEQTPLTMPLDAEREIRRTLTTLNCYACHSRDRRGGADGLRREYFTSVGAADPGEEARIPPTLTGIGAKLRPELLKTLLDEGTKLRPHMATRMPRYGPANVAHLPALFEKADARPDAPRAKP